MALDFHNPYCSLWVHTFAGAPLPWEEKKIRQQKRASHGTSIFGQGVLGRDKKVSFSSKVSVILIPSRRDFHERTRDIWWSELEIEKSKKVGRYYS